MIIEGIMTTLDEKGVVNVSPLGAIMDNATQRCVLRPYKTTKTYGNLKKKGQGVFHITDDVEMMARAAVGRLDPPPLMENANAIEGRILTGACRWYAVRVCEIDDARPRARIVTEVVDQGRQRDFIGLNRAKHAVVEAAILATRIDILPAGQISEDLTRLEPLVEKTGGEAERRAFDFLAEYVKAAEKTERLIE
jgi:hypothetical protein